MSQGQLGTSHHSSRLFIQVGSSACCDVLSHFKPSRLRTLRCAILGWHIRLSRGFFRESRLKYLVKRQTIFTQRQFPTARTVQVATMATQHHVPAIVTPTVGARCALKNITLTEPQAEEVLVEMHASGVCHTDIAMMNGTYPDLAFPAVLGHEGMECVL